MKKYRNIAVTLRVSVILMGCLVFTLFILPGCKKFVVADPPVTLASAATVYASNTSAAAVLSGIYTNMIINSQLLSSGTSSVGAITGLSGDELVDYIGSNPVYSQPYNDLMTSDGQSFWPEIYQQIHVANAAVEGLNNSQTLTPAVKTRLLGEAKFIRAFLHFYAVNLYGDVPSVTGSDYRINTAVARTTVDQVYIQIIQDLKESQIALSDDYTNGTGTAVTERVRPNKATATSLLSRVYLYKKDYASAITETNKVIGNTTYTLELDLNNVFSTTSQEAIWQLQSVAQGYNTFDGYGYVLASLPNGQTPFALNTQLVSAFTEGDGRFTNWVGSYTADNVNYYYYPNKYKVGVYDPSLLVTEYTTVFRLAEQYLIRAEAKIQLGQVADGIADLNTLRKRARLTPTVAVPNPLPDLSTALSSADAMKAVLHERQVELFTEWGHRWFDLKRTGNIDAVMSVVAPLKGSGVTWEPYKALFPIPKYDVDTNPNMKQNPGYQ